MSSVSKSESDRARMRNSFGAFPENAIAQRSTEGESFRVSDGRRRFMTGLGINQSGPVPVIRPRTN